MDEPLTYLFFFFAAGTLDVLLLHPKAKVMPALSVAPCVDQALWRFFWPPIFIWWAPFDVPACSPCLAETHFIFSDSLCLSRKKWRGLDGGERGVSANEGEAEGQRYE